MAAVRILGIDPGLRRTGWGLIESAGARLTFVAAGTIRPREDASLPDRLACLFTGLCDAIDTWAPVEAAVEQTFVNKDARATLKLGQARGAAIVACSVGRLAIHEYSANQIKQSLVGRGHASKTQIQHMVRVLLNLREPPQADAADALAVAICHAHTHASLRRIPGRAARAGRAV